MNDPVILLLCTVGGSPEPLVASILRWKPSRVIFLPPGCIEIRPVDDAQDFASCVHAFRNRAADVEAWLKRGDQYVVVVDFTGGTKCMTAALALQAHRWRCRFSYVGGTERTKGGVGVVVSGQEKVVQTENPWNALGYQAIEDAVTLFDQGARYAGAKRLEESLREVTSEPVKREINTLKTLIEAYDDWDRFDHKDALNKINSVLKNVNDLLALFGEPACREIRSHLEKDRSYLHILINRGDAPSREIVYDLLANAKRRWDEGRFDDAAARIYRATEALAQTVLCASHGIKNTKNVPSDQIPKSLQQKWSSRIVNGTMRLGLQDDYLLLAELGDEVGRRFGELKWDDFRRSPLSARNDSILAHGFQPVKEKIVGNLWTGILRLTGVEEADLPEFPKIVSEG